MVLLDEGNYTGQCKVRKDIDCNTANYVDSVILALESDDHLNSLTKITWKSMLANAIF